MTRTGTRTGTRPSRTVRAVLAPVLLTLACLLVPLGTLSTWAAYEIGDSGRYVSAMAPLAADPGVQEAVGAAVTTGIMANISVGPLQSTVEQYLHDAVVSFTGTPAFQNAWNTANRAAHDAVQQALDEGGTDAVTLDLAPVTQQVKHQLQDDGVPFAAQIPVTHTEITVLSADDLAELRTWFHRLQLAGPWPPLASLVLTATGLLLAPRRRRALVATALGMALGAAALLIALSIARSLTLGDVDGDADKAAAGAVYDALTQSMRTVSWVIVGVGAAVAVAAWLTGRFGFGLPLPGRGAARSTDPGGDGHGGDAAGGDAAGVGGIPRAVEGADGRGAGRGVGRSLGREAGREAGRGLGRDAERSAGRDAERSAGRDVEGPEGSPVRPRPECREPAPGRAFP